ncbi:blue copper protein 1a [Ricinus communis]|uniref:Blue copper protein, putative n=1 Tax=Ricinus communis TaxID=3988 RepID=B9RBW4_RICCO|nr:blue copper protein 1a [Ricinus communis]EEF51035.1 Blue copper protein precursor, putative [Ricinus communis]|eukprot:XP_025012094.1 basic blue protein [Ricinus communis]
MASSKIFVVIAILTVSVPLVLAVEHLVGDETGWTTNFNYQSWAAGKEFHVSDKLVFKYPAGVHNVLRVDGTGFQECTAPATTEALTSGEDTITLASPGKKWYICTVGKHCESGNMKLAITVLPELGSPETSPSPVAASPSPSENPVSAAIAGVNVSGSYILVFAIAAILGLVVA